MTIQNQDDNKSIKFIWPDHPSLMFSPKVGHLHPGCSKDIKITLCSSSPVKLDGEKVTCAISEVSYGDVDPKFVPDWDDRIQTVNWIDVEVNGRITKKKVFETEHEPAAKIIEDLQPLLLLVNGIVDYSSAAVEVDAVRNIFISVMSHH